MKKKFLKSKLLFNDVGNRSYSVIVDVDVQPILTGYNANLTVMYDYSGVIVKPTIPLEFSKDFTSVEVIALMDSVVVDSSLDAYEINKIKELEICKMLIESDSLLFNGGVNLVATDFEIV